MHQIQIGPRTIFAPTHWNDLTLAELLGCVTAASFTERNLTEEDRMWAMSQVLLNITDAERQQIASACTPDLEVNAGRFARTEAYEIGQTGATDILRQLAEQVTAFAFAKTEGPYRDPNDISDDAMIDIEEEDKQPLTIAFLRTKQPLPVFELPLPFTHKLHAPEGDGFKGLNLLEFIASSHHYINAASAKTQPVRRHHIARIIAIIWQPKTEGKRQPFTKDNTDVDYMADTIRQLQPALLEAIWFWYASSYEQVRITFPALFHKPSASAKTSARSSFGLVGMLYELSEDLTKVDEVAGKSLFDTFTYASYQIASNADAAAAAAPRPRPA